MALVSRIRSGIHSIYTIEGPGGTYVGCTRAPIERRLRQHHWYARHGSMDALHCAMREHGCEAFELRHVASACGLRNGHAIEVAIIRQYEADGVPLFNLVNCERITAQQHVDAWIRRLLGADLDLLARELGIPRTRLEAICPVSQIVGTRTCGERMRAAVLALGSGELLRRVTEAVERQRSVPRIEDAA